MQENSLDKSIYFCTKDSKFINVYKQTYFQIDIDNTEFQFDGFIDISIHNYTK